MSPRPSVAGMDRRRFVQSAAVTAGALATGALTAGLFSPAVAAEADAKPRLKKAVKYGMVGAGKTMLEKFQIVKELGFDGIELDSPNEFDVKQVLAARDQAELPIHGLVDSVHWRETLSHPDPEVRARGLEGLKTALRDAKAYGATTVLLVPAVVNAEVSYDDAYQRSQAEIRKALPLAEELEITIALENVWNNFLLSPLETAQYIDEFESPRVKAYFDVGNVVRYGWPAQWVRILGPRIAKLDIKEFSRKLSDEQGLWKGFQVEIGDGDCDWPQVMQALDEIGYSGWATAEVSGGNQERLAEIAQRMDRVFAM